MSPLDPIFQVNELPLQLFPGMQTPSTYPLPQLLMSEATTIYLNIWRGWLPSASLGVYPLPSARGDECCQCWAALLSPVPPGPWHRGPQGPALAALCSRLTGSVGVNLRLKPCAPGSEQPLVSGGNCFSCP